MEDLKLDSSLQSVVTDEFLQNSQHGSYSQNLSKPSEVFKYQNDDDIVPHQVNVEAKNPSTQVQDTDESIVRQAVDSGGACVDNDNVLPIPADESKCDNLYDYSVDEVVDPIDASVAKKCSASSFSFRDVTIRDLLNALAGAYICRFPATRLYENMLLAVVLCLFFFQCISGLLANPVNMLARNGTMVCFPFVVEPPDKKFDIWVDGRVIYSSNNGRQSAKNLNVTSCDFLHNMCYNPVLAENGKIHEVIFKDGSRRYSFRPIILYNESCSTNSSGATYSFQLTDHDNNVFLMSPDTSMVRCKHSPPGGVSCHVAGSGMQKQRDCLCGVPATLMVTTSTNAHVASMFVSISCCDCIQSKAASIHQLSIFKFLLPALSALSALIVIFVRFLL